MFKLVQQAPVRANSCKLILNASSTGVNGLNGPIAVNPIGLSNAESRRFARNTKPWKTGPIEQIKKGVITYEYRRLRAKKVAKIEMPNFEEYRDIQKTLTPDEMRSKLKEKGVVPKRNWDERPIYIGTLNMIIDPYVPPEGDGQVSIISKESAKKQMDKLTGKGKDFLAMRKIRSYLPDFEATEWINEAQEIYRECHQALVDRDVEKLYTLATEKALPEMIWNVEKKTIRWQLLRSLEPARVVHIRTEDSGTGSTFAQLTVRFHTQQTLAVYDRFGRLLNGSEAIVRDVLDYVVFERALTDTYGRWKIHSKIVPTWNEKQHSYSRMTTIKPKASIAVDETQSAATN